MVERWLKECGDKRPCARRRLVLRLFGISFSLEGDMLIETHKAWL